MNPHLRTPISPITTDGDPARACFLSSPPRSDLATLYDQEGRRLVSDTVCAELIAAAADGPRASDRFAAVTATAVAGLAGSVRAAEVVANFLDRCGHAMPSLPACLHVFGGGSQGASAAVPAADECRQALKQASSVCSIEPTSRCCLCRRCACRLGGRLEGAAAGGDTLCCHNLVMVTAHLYLAGALKADVVFSMLDSWRERYVRVCLWVCGCPASQHALLPACMQGWLADTASDAACLPLSCRIAPSLFSL